MLGWFVSMALAGSPLTPNELDMLVEQPTSGSLAASPSQTGLSIELPEDLQPMGSRVRGKVVWQYQGQMVFAEESTPAPTATRVFDGASTPNVIRLRAFDAYGRAWESDTTWPAAEAPTNEAPMTGLVEWIPHQWTGEDCIDDHPRGPSRNDHFWWQGNSQVPAAEDGMQSWEANSVLVDNRRALSTCSGALVSASGRAEPTWALTAAHCIEAGPLGQFAFPGDISIMTADTREWYTVATVVIPASYSSWPGTDFRSDIALLELVPHPGSLKPEQSSDAWEIGGTPRYHLSTSGTVESEEPGRMVSWPTYVQQCDVARWDAYSNVDDTFGKQRRRHVQLYMDGGPGQSGSPVGRCDGECASRRPGGITAVYAGWNSLSKVHVGPWVPFYADALNGVMQ